MKTTPDREDLERANAWYFNHTKHVKSLISDTEYAVPPSGSDTLHPELWKGCHWKWFLQIDGKDL